MEFIFFPLALVSAGAGVYLLATSGSSVAVGPPKTGLVIDPQFGPGGGKLDLTYHW